MKYDTWEKRKNLGNIGKALKEFEGQINAEVRRQEKINMAEERDFRRGELSEKYMAKLLYGITNKILTGCDTGDE